MNFLLGPSLAVPEVSNQLESSVVGLGARIGEQHMLVARWQQRRKFRRKFDRPGIRCLEKVIVVGERLESLVPRLGQLLVPISDLDTPKTRHAVDDLLAFGIPQIDAASARDDADALLVQSCSIGKGMNVMRRIERLPMFRLIAATWRHRTRTPQMKSEMVWAPDARTRPVDAMG